VNAHETYTIEEWSVTVAVTRDLVEALGQWSQPVRVMIRETPGVGTGWELICRTLDWEETTDA
jgi:hypothetical protein